MELVYASIILVLAIVLILFMQKGNKQREQELKNEINRLSADKDAIQKEQMEKIREIAETRVLLQSKDEQLRLQQEELLNTRAQLNKDFQILANQILEEKTLRFTDMNRSNMEAILKPLNEKLVEFRVKVEETYDKESKQRFSLEERIRELVALNNQISEDANNLTKALKGNNKIQGNWGEMILESILEKSGLKKGEEYFTQEFIVDENGSRVRNAQDKYMQPDVVVVYPGGRKIIIDSKVSLSAYVKYVEAGSDDIKLVAEKEHVISIKQHIDELSQKSYQDYVESLDFVMMFIPNEPAYILAMQLDSTLWDYAYRKRILLISPTNLIASLKVVSDLWKREYQSRNAIEIAKRGAALYDKFAGFVDTLQDVGKNIERSQKSYDKAFSQLKEGNGNLMRQAEMLKELGVKAQKELPDSNV
ncbi:MULTISPECIES: DNA recombination protein RmuC [unclassified Dysgonomonas]|jgi:DNA recombination protein RmuC|uniref:DNA recombination protein RmuC n=1 Tax=unclassified Dysgonomonas TaxID=2630389 RepID=UPI0025C4D9E4|nr:MULTISPECIES: DNA recombination protein RmuC [unclassified Dysgonomonas]MDR2005556.1 DNA recombination protein RmuC [Prevotella sp.]HMM01487.1 DNA recombination protein RmuC [Dysgonomonas sp.]